MKTNNYNPLKTMWLGVLSFIMLACSESPVDELKGTPEDLHVVTNTTVIRADESVPGSDIIGVRNVLTIGSASDMDSRYLDKAIPMSAYMNTVIPALETKSFVKTTVRKARLMSNDTGAEQTLTGWPIDLEEAISNMIESLRSRLGNNRTFSIIVEIWFDPVSDFDYTAND